MKIARPSAVPPATSLKRPGRLTAEELAQAFAGVQTYCMFLGHARSGHSLFGSLLDAHPDIVLAHEFHALKKLQEGITRDELFRGIWQRSIRFTRMGRKWNGYEYKVPSQWQGRCRELCVIGDKKGGASSAILKKNPRLLRQLHDTVGVPVKFFRVIRNPFDNIRTVSRYYFRDQLDPAIQDYFSRCATIEKFQREIDGKDWMDVYHEDFIASPKTLLKAAVHFLSLTTTPAYLKDCASIVFESPLKRRYEVKWTPAQRTLVEAGIRRFRHLSRYTFDS